MIDDRSRDGRTASASGMGAERSFGTTSHLDPSRPLASTHQKFAYRMSPDPGIGRAVPAVGHAPSTTQALAELSSPAIVDAVGMDMQIGFCSRARFAVVRDRPVILWKVRLFHRKHTVNFVMIVPHDELR
jgi:hypothetical protein